MIISSATRRMATAGVVTLALLAALGIWWPSGNEQTPQEEDKATPARPLFAGWIQPGHHHFGPASREPAGPDTPQPRWVLATEAEARSELEKQPPGFDQSELASQSAAESFQQRQKPMPAPHGTEPVEPGNTLQ